MTETLSSEEIVKVRKRIQEFYATNDPAYGRFLETTEKALNTIEAKDKEVEALKRQVVVANNALLTYLKSVDSNDQFNAAANAIKVTSYLKAASESFIAKERADEREKTIRECLEVRQKEFDRLYGTKFMNLDSERVFSNIKSGLESLLTKEQA